MVDQIDRIFNKLTLNRILKWPAMAFEEKTTYPDDWDFHFAQLGSGSKARLFDSEFECIALTSLTDWSPLASFLDSERLQDAMACQVSQFHFRRSCWPIT